MKPTKPDLPPLAAPVGVIGLGAVSAAGNCLADTLDTLEQGRIRLSPPPFATAHPFPVFLCSLAEQTAGDDSIPFSRTVRLAVQAAREALNDAGLSADDPPEPRLGIAVGTSVGASLDFYDFYTETVRGLQPALDEIDAYLASNPALALGRLLNCRGPFLTVTNACSSGTDAVGMAAEWIRSGLCDLALAGGADALSSITYAGFSSLRLPSPKACRPFDASRDGLSLGEGAGFLLLASDEIRRERMIRAKGFVLGYGTATDAYHVTAPHPDGAGLDAATRQAFSQAGLAGWDDVAFINAHGTATQANDAAEGVFFKRHCPDVPFIATKGATGHTLGAAGALEAIFTLAHLKARRLPASPGFRDPDPRIGLAPTREPTPVRGRAAVSQSLAFGGNNSVLVLGMGEA